MTYDIVDFNGNRVDSNISYEEALNWIDNRENTVVRKKNGQYVYRYEMVRHCDCGAV